MTANQNEGEGNKTAARAYNEAQRRFIKEGKVEAAARDAEQALDGPEQRALQEAEAIGKSKAAPDPESDDQKGKSRPDGQHKAH
jgi:hypothetical protein